MIKLPDFHSHSEEFDKPICAKLQFNGDTVTWFKLTGYDDTGRAVGTVVNYEPEDDWFSIHNLESQFQAFTDNQFYTYVEIDEEEYLKAFNRVVEKLK